MDITLVLYLAAGIVATVAAFVQHQMLVPAAIALLAFAHISF